MQRNDPWVFKLDRVIPSSIGGKPISANPPTPDRRSVPSRFLIFTSSPHETARGVGPSRG